jgi:predicted HTH transcriptional regulator
MLSNVLNTYPQPIAYAYGNVYRAMSKPEKLDQIFRCAEVTARYLSALAIASFAAREDASVPPPEGFQQFDGNLSFGNFLTLVQSVVVLSHWHPLRNAFHHSLKGRNNAAKSGLDELLRLRNQFGHSLQGLSEAAAVSCLDRDRPLQLLEEVLQGIEPLASHPLFVVDAQRPVRCTPHIVRLLLMGQQSDPVPEQVAVTQFFMEEKRLYLGIEDGALMLHPMLVWDLEENRATQGIYLLHRIHADALDYESLAVFSNPANLPAPAEMRDLLQGANVPNETAKLPDGRSFVEEWQQRRQQINSGQTISTQTVPWADFDGAMLNWYKTVLQKHIEATGQGENVDWRNPQAVIRQFLLDGRGEVTPEEQRQLLLLFGKKQDIRPALSRNILDLRARQSPDSRWDERQELATNLLDALKQAVAFIGRYTPHAEGLSPDGLQATTGSADYVAVREALINLFIHQDYTDQRTVAQIELEPQRTTLVNAGASLISEQELADGGTSTARNPLIARALKLIGFAELGGSGLREVYRVWRNADRRPPKIRSDEDNNRFRIELDSRPIQRIEDGFWMTRLGASVSPEEAQILGLLGTAQGGLSLSEIASGTGHRYQDVESRCGRLHFQGLLVQQAETAYDLQPHLYELAREALSQPAQPH